MVGWFYINDEVAAPVRMLETDELSGVLSIEVAARFVPSRSMLRGNTIVEYRHWSRRRLVRCLGAEHVGQALMIEAVDVGLPQTDKDINDKILGAAEDWLAVNGVAYCQITGFSQGDQPNGHCLFHVDLAHWRDLRIGESALLASVGITLGPGHDNDGSITPLLHAARELPSDSTPPMIEVIRLRERQRLTITPIATDWGDESTLIVSRVHDTQTLGATTRQVSISAR